MKILQKFNLPKMVIMDICCSDSTSTILSMCKDSCDRKKSCRIGYWILCKCLTYFRRMERYELKEYPNDTLNIMHDLRLSELLCDVTIKLKYRGTKREFPAHRLVLSACSPYFRAMFTGSRPAPLRCGSFCCNPVSVRTRWLSRKIPSGN